MATTTRKRNSSRAYYEKNRNKILARSKAYAKKHPEKRKAYSQTYADKNREAINNRARAYSKTDAHKSSRLKYMYGITLAEKKQIAAAQKHRCAICNKKKPLDVDHKHGTKKVRGLLCNTCNVLLGQANEDIQVLESAIHYLTTAENRVH